MGEAKQLEDTEVIRATGMKTPEQLTFLQKQGCHLFQGYLHSRPVPIEGFRVLLTD
ncbi:EAL domain-containing protein [Pseudomonas nabeulensis]|uniref:EAL domain-containing protein n=1 Tax=Pseudomonas nabeulensis TaxID=2293833 RepID=A0A4Z0B759_9PSED|nr:EAL domain-containing protein [Pseudomonas nabeulensis]